MTDAFGVKICEEKAQKQIWAHVNVLSTPQLALCRRDSPGVPPLGRVTPHEGLYYSYFPFNP